MTAAGQQGVANDEGRRSRCALPLAFAAERRYVGWTVATVSIRDILLPALRQRFPDRPFIEGVAPEPVATFPAAHSAVGDLLILDDGQEATVVIGRHTHSHFNPYDATLSPAQLANAVTDSVLEFLTDVFADRVLIWSVPERSGGWKTLSGEPLSMPGEAVRFVWSGPLPIN